MKKWLVLLTFLTFFSNQFGSMPAKIPLYAFYTPSHQKLKDEWFLPSLKDDFDLHITYSPQEGKGEFGQQDYLQAMLKKVDLIIDAIKQNYNGIFIYCDVDIQFFKPVKKILLNNLQGYDLLIQRDSPDGKVCAGFFIARANKIMLKLWLKIKEEMIQDNFYDDQTILNTILLRKRREFPVVWNYLPTMFMSGGTFTGKHWKPGDELFVPHDIVMHHANWTIGIPHKIAQLEYVKKIVQARTVMHTAHHKQQNSTEDYQGVQ